MNFTTLDLYIGLAINGVFTGLGVAIGTYIAQKHVIKKSKSLYKKVINKLP